MVASGCGGDSGSDAKPEGKETAAKETGAKATAEPVRLQTTAHEVKFTDDADQSHKLRVTPKSLARGSESDLSGVRLSDDLKDMLPYYLTVSFSNTDNAPLTPRDLLRTLSVAGADGSRAKEVTVMGLGSSSGAPDQCRNGNPDTLAAGDTAELCKLVMFPKGQEPATVAYTDDASGTVIWTAGDGKAGGSGVLEMGESADAVVEDSDDNELPVQATAKSVEKGSLAHLSRFKLNNADMKVPYYVRIEYVNNGKHDLYPGMQSDVTVQTAAGEQVRKLTLIDIGGPGVEQCPDNVPDGMVKPGAKVTQCSVHMVPEGDRPAAITWKGDGADAKVIAWRAGSES